MGGMGGITLMAIHEFVIETCDLCEVDGNTKLATHQYNDIHNNPISICDNHTKEIESIEHLKKTITKLQPNTDAERMYELADSLRSEQ